MDTLWSSTSFDKKYKELDKDLDIDILIIGGGITGLNIAYNLLNEREKIVLVEANRVGSGVTSRMTGKISYLQGCYYDIYKKYGRTITKKYFLSQLEAIEIIKRIIADNKIKCNFEKTISYLYTDNYKYLNRLKQEENILRDIGCILEKGTKKDFLYSIKVFDTYTFHPLKYLYSLKKIISKKIPIYENTRVLGIEKYNEYYLVKTDKGIIKTKRVVLANFYPNFIKPFFMPLKVTLQKSYIGVSSSEMHNYTTLSVDNKQSSMRFYKDKNINYKIYSYGNVNISNENNMSKRFLKLKRDNYNYLWSNMDIMTGDFMPFIGRLDKNLYIATGYNTWGITNSILSGKIIGDLIRGDSNKYEGLFNPKRKIYKNTFLAVTSSFKAYLKELIYHNKSWYHGRITFQDNKAILSDGVDKHVVLSKCPHMGCNLVYNEVEKTWDCPCHGSRFSALGNVICGPSNKNIKVENDKKN